MFIDDSVDFHQLENYGSIIINTEEITNGKNIYHKHPFRFCNEKDYVGIKVLLKQDVKNRLCPNVDDDMHDYKVKNSLMNKHNRNSYAIEIRKCDRVLNQNCESEYEIEQFFKNVYFSLNVIKSRVDFRKTKDESNMIKLGES